MIRIADGVIRIADGVIRIADGVIRKGEGSGRERLVELIHISLESAIPTETG